VRRHSRPTQRVRASEVAIRVYIILRRAQNGCIQGLSPLRRKPGVGGDGAADVRYALEERLAQARGRAQVLSFFQGALGELYRSFLCLRERDFLLPRGRQAHYAGGRIRLSGGLVSSGARWARRAGRGRDGVAGSTWRRRHIRQVWAGNVGHLLALAPDLRHVTLRRGAAFDQARFLAAPRLSPAHLGAFRALRAGLAPLTDSPRTARAARE
jgi:hypothetical protein